VNAQRHWIDINDRFLAATIEIIRIRLQQAAARIDEQTQTESKGSWLGRDNKSGSDSPSAPTPQEIDEKLALAQQEIAGLQSHDPPPALLLLAERLGLSEFDCEILALCAGMELDTQFASLCAQAQGDQNKPYPTFALAFTLFDDPDWSAMSPHSSLRHWRLLEINQPGSQSLTGAALSADERIVNYLKGLNYLDDRITPLVDPVQVGPAGVQNTNRLLPPSQQQLVDGIIECIKRSNGTDRMPFIELLGRESVSKRVIAGRVASSLGLNLYGIDLKSLPGQIGDFETFSRLWKRESLLMPLALYIDVTGPEELDKSQLKRFLERNIGLVFLDTEDAEAESTQHRFSVEVNKPTPEEQEQLWTEVLQDSGGDQPQYLAEQFSFNQSEIIRLAKITSEDNDPPRSSSQSVSSGDKGLWQACRIAARVGMEKLARRIDAKARWEQLILPPSQTSLLHEIADQMACRNLVYEEWGFREQMNRGLGINALFAGESGTGKTMAAEVIANALELDLYRIDLSAVVSKYIGETEKNLRKLFNAAEDSGAIIFFDEADALFGKRSEVKDSHDRYANIEINYLLQRMESYQGVAILATNMKSALDKAFVRRLRFIVDFPFPGIEERTQIWQKIFPPDTPLDQNFDFKRLAKLSLTGGNIHNVAINAAFLAAKNGSAISMPLVLEAARNEFRKLERPTKDSDFTWKGSLEAVL
jgi:hypothetical protein